MSRLDDELRRALGREDPGPEFTARVLARAAAAPPARRRVWWFPNLRWAAAAAAACVLIVTAGVEYREWQVRVQGETAKRELVRALHIAGTKLNQARDKVRALNAPRGES